MSLSSKENSIRRRKDSLDLQGAGMVSWRAHDWVVAPIAGENNLIFNSDCPACTCSQIERFRGPSTSKFTWLQILYIWLFGGAVKVDGYFETWNFCHTALRLHASEEPGAAPWNIHICQHFKYWVSPPSPPCQTQRCFRLHVIFVWRILSIVNLTQYWSIDVSGGRGKADGRCFHRPSEGSPPCFDNGQLWWSMINNGQLWWSLLLRQSVQNWSRNVFIIRLYSSH